MRSTFFFLPFLSSMVMVGGVPYFLSERVEVAEGKCCWWVRGDGRREHETMYIHSYVTR